MKPAEENHQDGQDFRGILPIDAAFLDGLRTLSSPKILEKVLSHPDCPRLIRSMSSEDFFFLIKKVGEDSSLELLKMASPDQWQYVLDLETWENDRLDLDRTGRWLELLLKADPDRLTEWLFSEGEWLAYYYLHRGVAVGVRDEETEDDDFGPEFFTIDGFFYVRPYRENDRDVIEALLRSMARKDTLKYQSIMTGLAGVLPAELEEEMYRMRSVRLAEHGFLPREEAMAVFAPLDPERLKIKAPDPGLFSESQLEDVGTVPRWPLQTISERNLLTETLSNLTDERLLDRIRLEFAGLCNQMLSAEGLSNWDPDGLLEIQRQAAGYLNLILRERSHEDTKTALKLLKKNTLIALFRAGFGLAVGLKWKAERWLKDCWFNQAGLDPSFWGKAWEGVLTGLRKTRPLFYSEGESGEDFRHFQTETDLSKTDDALDFMVALDRMMRELTNAHPLHIQEEDASQPTIHQLLITLWARELLSLTPGFDAIPLEAAKRFLRLLRKGETKPPYRMFGFEERFIKAFAGPHAGVPFTQTLKRALERVWRDFNDEMAFVPADQFDAKYSRYILITSDS